MKNTVFHTLALLVTSFDLVATVKVVVVGAGTSGLAAARTLTDTWDTDENGGPLELTVLEAGTRIGGRTWTLNASEAGAAWNTAGALGAPTDMGASWIHGSTSTHPITKIATALGLATGSGLVRTRDNLAELRLCTAGKTSACSEPNNDEFTAYENLLSQAQESAEDSDTDISLWQALSGLSSSGQNRESKLFQYHLATGAEFNTAGPVTQLSAWNYDDDSQYSGTELVWAQGYKVMYEALQSGAVRVNDGSSTLQVAAVASASRQPILVTYNKRVTSVTYSSTGVVLTTADGSTYNADYVIITIPLGVLKSTDASSRVTFSPALPPATANGIAQLGFGNVVKIALLFPTVWWPTGTHYYGLAQAGTDRGLFTYFLNVHALSTKPVLMTFALGASADTAEGMSNAAVWTQVRSPSLLQHTSCASRAWAWFRTNLLVISHASPPASPSQIRANLVKIFPRSVTVPTTAPQMIRSTWRANPLAKGAYTYVAVGASTNPSLPPLAVPFSDLPLSCPESFYHGRYVEEHHHGRLWWQCRREALLCRRAYVRGVQRDCPRRLPDWPGAHTPHLPSSPTHLPHVPPIHLSLAPVRTCSGRGACRQGLLS